MDNEQGVSAMRQDSPTLGQNVTNIIAGEGAEVSDASLTNIMSSTTDSPATTKHEMSESESEQHEKPKNKVSILRTRIYVDYEVVILQPA